MYRLWLFALLQPCNLWLCTCSRRLDTQAVARRAHSQQHLLPSNPGLSGDEAAQMVLNALQDTTRKGNTWDHFFPYEIAKDLQQEISVSFSAPARMLTKSSSRSGAHLMLSHDGKFFAKTMKEYEFQTLWKFASDATATSFYREMMCASLSFGMSRCRDSLILPFYLAFAVEMDEKPLLFALMPAAFNEESSFFSKLPNFEKDHLGEMLDIKPFPNRSEMSILVKLLKKLGLVLNDFDGYSALQQRAAADVGYLRRGDLIDYSFLVWNGRYIAATKIDLGRFPSCIQQCTPRLREGGVSCTVICFSIIDYLMEFTLDRHLESKAKYAVGRGDKFLDYGGKARDMLQCFGDIMKLGLEFIECRPYLSAACSSDMDDVVCHKVALQTEEDKHIFEDLFKDVSALAADFVKGCFKTGVFIGAAVTWPMWLPAYATVKIGEWYIKTVWSITKWFFNAFTFCYFCPDPDEEARKKQEEFLLEQVEAKLLSENDKAAFQNWCQVPGRFWRSLHSSECVDTEGLRWNMAHKRWESTWVARDERVVLGYAVEFPTQDAFKEDGTLKGTFNDFDTALDKARTCLKHRRADLCLQSGGVAAGIDWY